MDRKKTQYNTVTVSACEGGWLVKQRGRPDTICVRWESVLRLLERELTSKDDGSFEVAERLRLIDEANTFLNGDKRENVGVVVSRKLKG